jgi:hypothetical protein
MGIGVPSVELHAGGIGEEQRWFLVITDHSVMDGLGSQDDGPAPEQIEDKPRQRETGGASAQGAASFEQGPKHERRCARRQQKTKPEQRGQPFIMRRMRETSEQRVRCDQRRDMNNQVSAHVLAASLGFQKVGPTAPWSGHLGQSGGMCGLPLG